MIYEGSNGSINIFFNDLLISSFGLHDKKRTYNNFRYNGEYMIQEELKTGLNLRKQILTYKYFINQIYKRKKNKQPIRRSDHELFICSIFALIKLKQLKEEDHVFIMPRRDKCKGSKLFKSLM